MRLPFLRSGAYIKWARFEIDSRIRALEIQGGRYQFVFESQHRFDQPGHSGGGVEVADVCLDRTDSAIAPAIGSRAKYFG